MLGSLVALLTSLFRLCRRAKPASCALTPTGVGAGDGANRLATGFKNFAGHLLLPLYRSSGVGFYRAPFDAQGNSRLVCFATSAFLGAGEHLVGGVQIQLILCGKIGDRFAK